MRWRERAGCGLVLDLIKLVLTSYDAHLSHAAVLCRLMPIVTRRGTRVRVKPQPRRGLTCSEAVAAGVALQLLFAVLAVKVILAGRAEVHWNREKEIGQKRSDGTEVSPHRSGTRTELAGGGSRGRVDGSRGGSCLDATEDGLAAVSAVSSAAGCLWRLLPVVVESNQLTLK